MMRTFSLVLAGLLFLAGCASEPKKVSMDEPEKLDKTYQNRTGDKSETVGAKGSDIVVQKKISLEEDLRKTNDSIEDLENSIYGASRKDPGGIWLKLQECRKRLADPRVGGNGTPDAMEKWEKLSESDPDFQYRVEDGNQIVAVSEEQLQNRLARLRKTKNILERRYDEYKEKIDSCENKYRTALVQHGLDPEDTKAEGQWVEGPNGYKVWKMTQPASGNPEELMRRKEEREKKRQKSTSN